MFAKRDKHYPSRSGQTSLATAVANFTKPRTSHFFDLCTCRMPSSYFLLGQKRQNPIEWRVFIIPVALTRTCIPIRFHTCYGWLHFWDRVWGTDIEFESSKIHKARHVRLHSLKSARELFPGSKGNSQWRIFHWIIAFDLCKVHHATWRNTAHVKINH